MSYAQKRRTSSGLKLPKPRLPPVIHENGNTNWNEVMLRNTEYLAWARILYPNEKFVTAGDVDEYRAKRGLK